MDLVTLGLAKKYTEDTTIGLGAIKGAPATIEKIEAVDGGNNIIFSWTANDGSKTEKTTLFVRDGLVGPQGPQGPQGPRGPRGENGNGVGKLTKDGGEIFNDYEENFAELQSHAEGRDTSAGSVICSYKVIAQSAMDAAYTLESLEGFRELPELDEGQILDSGTAYTSIILTTGVYDEGQLIGKKLHIIPRIKSIEMPTNTIFVEPEDFVLLDTFTDENETVRIYEPSIDRNLFVLRNKYGELFGNIQLQGHIGDTYDTPGASHVEGMGTIALDKQAHAEGGHSLALGSYSHAEGKGAIAGAKRTHAEGQFTQALGNYSHVEGVLSSTYGSASHAEGGGTTTIGSYSHAEGRSTGRPYYKHNGKTDEEVLADWEAKKFNVALGPTSHTEGTDTIGYGPNSHAEGSQTYAGNNAHAEGQLTRAAGWISHAEGRETKVTGTGSHVEGYGTEATGNYQHVSGKYNTADKNKAVIIGNGEKDKPSNAYTLDWSGNAEFAGDVIAKGCNGKAGISLAALYEQLTSFNKIPGFTTNEGGEIFNNYVNNRASNKAHAEGNITIALGEGAHAEGKQTAAIGTSSHAEGYSMGSPLGLIDKTEAEIIALGEKKQYSIALGMYSHVEGYTTFAKGKYGHAEGDRSYARGDISHAEGEQTIAGASAHSEGSLTQANGWCSHAEGKLTKANGQYTHAEGFGTVAGPLNAQHVQGQYNVEDTGRKYAHIIGWGTADVPANIHTVDTQGNAWYAGTVETPKGLILQSPNGTRFTITVSDEGVLSATKI